MNEKLVSAINLHLGNLHGLKSYLEVPVPFDCEEQHKQYLDKMWLNCVESQKAVLMYSPPEKRELFLSAWNEMKSLVANI